MNTCAANQTSYRPLSPSELRRVVYHEAGHVVAALMCGEGIYNVQIGKAENGYLVADRRGRVVEAIGLTETTMDGHGHPLTVAAAIHSNSVYRGPMVSQVANAVFLAGAGYMAEGKLRRWSRLSVLLDAHGRHDWVNGVEKVMALGFDEAKSGTIVAEIWDQTASLIRGKSGWAAVEAVAEAIIWGKSAEQIEEIGRAHLGEVLPPGGCVPIYLPKDFRDEWPTQMAVFNAFMAGLRASRPEPPSAPTMEPEAA